MITKMEILIKTQEIADITRENILDVCTVAEIESNGFLRDAFL
jgi:hypothetical protein